MSPTKSLGPPQHMKVPLDAATDGAKDISKAQIITPPDLNLHMTALCRAKCCIFFNK